MFLKSMAEDGEGFVTLFHLIAIAILYLPQRENKVSEVEVLTILLTPSYIELVVIHHCTVNQCNASDFFFHLY